MAESIEQLSFELTTNALAEQERAVTALRARAGTILAAASIAGSFLGTTASHSSLDGWAVAALITFALCLGTAIVVLLPHEFVFAFRGRAVLAASDHEGIQDVSDAYRAADIWIRGSLDFGRQPPQDRRAIELVHDELRTAGARDHPVVLWTLSVAR
jgi:hypothetical protein